GVVLAPHGFAPVSKALRCGAEDFHNRKSILKEEGRPAAVGAEGGFAPRLGSNEEALKRILQAIEAAGYKPGEDVALALDCAASEFYNKSGTYTFDKKEVSAAELAEIYVDLTKRYPIVSIEDGFAEDDWEGWKLLT